MLRYAIVGTNWLSHIYYHAIEAAGDRVAAVCSRSRERAAERGQGKALVYTELDEMLKNPDIDVVYLCIPNVLHADAALRCLRAGKHVLCEKPMATSVEAAEAMLAAAKESGKHLQIGFVRRYGNDCALIQDLVKEGFFGDIYFAKASYLRRNGNPEGWFGDKSRSGGGPLYDLGVHVIDLVRYIEGNKKPVSVYGATWQKLLNRPNLKTPKAYYSASRTDHDICDVEDLAVALIRFEDGSVLSVEASFSLNIA